MISFLVYAYNYTLKVSSDFRGKFWYHIYTYVERINDIILCDKNIYIITIKITNITTYCSQIYKDMSAWRHHLFREHIHYINVKWVLYVFQFQQHSSCTVWCAIEDLANLQQEIFVFLRRSGVFVFPLRSYSLLARPGIIFVGLLSIISYLIYLLVKNAIMPYISHTVRSLI